MIRYAEKIFHISREVIDDVTDQRSLPRISTSLVVKAILAVYWSRLGSLHALEMTRAAKFWKAWLGRPLCSADSLGRIVACGDADTLRQGIHHVYDRLRPRHGAGRTSGDKKKAIRICLAPQKLAKPQITKHILSLRVLVAESLPCGRASCAG